jgi:hypothetical protein
MTKHTGKMAVHLVSMHPEKLNAEELKAARISQIARTVKLWKY